MALGEGGEGGEQLWRGEGGFSWAALDSLDGRDSEGAATNLYPDRLAAAAPLASLRRCPQTPSAALPPRRGSAARRGGRPQRASLASASRALAGSPRLADCGRRGDVSHGRG